MYQRYQKLWISFCDKNNVLEEYDDASLVKFFKQIEPVYKPNTLWVIHSCINARCIDEYGKHLKHLPRFHKHLKQVTQLYVETKLATFTPEEVHKVLHTIQDSSDKKLTLCGIAITLLYDGLLRCSEVRVIQAKDVQIVIEKDDTFIEINFKYQRKSLTVFLVPLFLCSFVPLFLCSFVPLFLCSFVPLFRNYMGQICPKAVESGKLQFLKTGIFSESAASKLPVSMHLLNFKQSDAISSISQIQLHQSHLA